VALKRELPHGPPIMMRRLNQNATVELGQTGENLLDHDLFLSS
jgi:hypothetical protein